MKRLLVYLKDYKKESILAPLFKLLEACFDLLVPLVMTAIIDVGIAQADRPYIYRMCLVLVLLAVVGMASAVTAQYFAAKAAVGFGAKVRHALFRHIQHLSFGEVDRIGTSTLITRLTSDCNTVQSGVNMALRLLLRSPIVVFGALIMAFTIDWQCALIVAAVIPLIAGAVFGITGITIPGYKRVQGKLDRVLGITHENLTGVRVLRAFRREDAEVERFDAGNEALTQENLRVGRVAVLLNPLTYLIINLGVLVIIYVGGFRVEAGTMTQGQIVALVNYMAQILVELVKLANLINQLSKMLSSADRIAAVLAVEPGMGAPENAPETQSAAPAVSFQNVSLTYQGAGAESLTELTFTAMPGETIGIVGGTGSGKSSLVELIPRFYDATVGSVQVDGIDVKDYPLSELRKKIGIVPQKAVLFTGTIRSNLKWGNEDATDEELWEALRLAQAEDVVKGKGGLDAVVAQNGRNFSGGQRQRLTIARALVGSPEILILDDSASALDYATDAALRKALRSIQNTTVFIVSQRASSLAHADQIIVLEDGKAVGIGTSRELLESCPVYQEIYYTQFQKPAGKEAQ
ncbi:MAG: ABC transporter ATP-binding protein/permease [Clostridiales bacterium]|nr:ABC transporter ATP-binding protein/permease [Clostridiales bacterium]